MTSALEPPRATTPLGSWLAAALVHAYTASGVVLALLMVHYAYAGEVRTVLWLFLASMVVDGTDGFLARHFRVKEVMPGFDGALLDNMVDYLTYAFAPMVLLWSTGYLPSGWIGGLVASIPLLASCYQFCRSDAKGDTAEPGDHHFLGFPSYWNIVAFYLIVLGASVTVSTAVLLVFAVLVFVPVKYLYPSRTERLWYPTMALTTAWFGLYAVIVAQMPDPGWLWVGLSLAYVGYYTVVSLQLTLIPRGFASRDRGARRSHPPPRWRRPPARRAGSGR